MTYVVLSQPRGTRESSKSHRCSKGEALRLHLPQGAEGSSLREKILEASQPAALGHAGVPVTLAPAVWTK